MTKKLLFSITKKDFDIQTFKAGGKGGQHQNKRNTGVRIIHRDSGAVGECREERSQYQNKRKAFKRLTKHPKFKIWHTQKVNEILEKETIKEKVDKMMSLENLKIEFKKGNSWIEEVSNND